MKQALSFLLLFFISFYFSQTQLKVINADNKKPVSDASVYCDDNLLGKTSREGTLTFKTKCKKVDILANDFEDEEATISKEMLVSLKPTSEKQKVSIGSLLLIKAIREH